MGLRVPLRLANPCQVDWAEMTPAPGGRHCAQCDKVVVDLTRATRREAIGLASVFGGQGLCGRVRHAGDGAVLFKSEARADRPLGMNMAMVAFGIGAAACHDAPRAVEPVTESPRAPHDVPSPPPASSSEAASASSTADHDGDGIPDAVDECPDDVGKAPDGCPASVRIIVSESGDLAVLQQVGFATGSVALDASGEEILKATADTLKAHPEIDLLEVHGNTDGREKNADALSRRRAEMVVARLVKLGVLPSRLIALADGSKRPIDSNQTSEGREKNRRIEFRVARTTVTAI